jgi:hypothetical protein
MIKTVRSGGYMFTPRVEPISVEPIRVEPIGVKAVPAAGN